MKRFLVLFIIITFLGCNLTYDEPEANVQVESWSEITNSPNNTAIVDFSIKNTGTANISSYEIYFDIVCTTTFSVSKAGLTIPIGETIIGRVYWNIGSETISSVIITDYDLENNYDGHY